MKKQFVFLIDMPDRDLVRTPKQQKIMRGLLQGLRTECLLISVILHNIFSDYVFVRRTVLKMV